ncbi:urease accessory protein UreD [Paenibacillus aurantiacus]|uniref:Urease accessory protein UreD n=1 Tax=Paenibacillus aurantiacus TaxID=1936118 RepID=A0ABV5L2A6_9BACL
MSRLRASFGSHGGHTRVDAKYHDAPIKIAKSFPLGGPLAVIMMDVSPGLLEGDRYEMDWTIGEDAHVYITNQSYTKVHPSDGLGSELLQRFALAPGAVAESMPEPVMLYKDASLLMETEVDLAPGALWMGAEVLCPGRTLRGELFHYRLYRNRMRVRLGGELIFAQNQRIDPASQLLDAPGCFGDLTHTGTFYAFSDAIGARQMEAVREALAVWPEREGQRWAAGVSLTHKHGMAVLAAGTSAWVLEELLHEARRALRASVPGVAPLAFRK